MSWPRLLLISLSVTLLCGCVALPEATPTRSVVVRSTLTPVPVAITTAAPGSTPALSATPSPSSVAGNVRLAIRESIATLNPYLAANPAEALVCSLLYDSLLSYSVSRGVQPNLARQWRVGAEGTTLTFWLNSAARWHDGAPVTTDDVLYSFDLVRDKAMPGTAATVSLITRVEALNAEEIRITLSSRRSDALRLIGTQIRIVPQHLWSKIDDPLQYTNLEAPVGSGPFVWDHMEGESVVLRSNTGHHQDMPRVAMLTLRRLHDEAEALQLVQKGELDGIGWAVAPRTAESVQSNPEGYPQVHVERTAGTHVVTLLLNLRKAPFSNRDFRRALALATDSNAVIVQGMQGLAEPASPCLFAPASAWRNGEIKPISASQDQAAQILQRAGFVDKDGDGQRENPDGSKLTIPILCSKVDGQKEIVALIAAGWKATGLAATAQPVPPDQVLPMLIQGNFDAALYEISLLEPEDPYLNLHSTRGVVREGRLFGANYGGYASAELDELAVACLEEADTLAQRDLMARLQKALADDLPQIPLYAPQTLTIHRESTIGNWQPEPGAGLLSRNTIVHLQPVAGLVMR